jgi:hypothetical protein
VLTLADHLLASADQVSMSMWPLYLSGRIACVWFWMPSLGLVSSAFGLECVVLLLGGDWPGLRTDGPTIFGALPDARGR